MANLPYIANMLNTNIDPIFLHMSTKIQPISMDTSCVIAQNVPEMNIPTKLGICII